MNEESESARVATMSHGEQKPRSFEEAFGRYESSIGQFLAQVVRSRPLAEDLLQETFLAALTSRGGLDAAENVRAWLYGIARNRALQALRSRRRRDVYERLARSPDDSAEDPAEAVAVRDLLTRHLKSRLRGA